MRGFSITHILTLAAETGRQPARSRSAMVVARREPLAADVGLAVLKSGGDAMEAAIGFALPVMHPSALGIDVQIHIARAPASEPQAVRLIV